MLRRPKKQQVSENKYTGNSGVKSNNFKNLKKWAQKDSNLRPPGYEPEALTN